MSGTKALQLLSRFSLPPNSLGYCGKNSAVEKFKSCIISGNCQGVKTEINKFLVLFPYLKAISKITNLPILDYRVIESFWLGNDLLKKATQKDYLFLLENFSTQGIPQWLIKELKQKHPAKFIPHHLFQVLHVGVGRASSGVVPFNLDSINNCMIRWGKVEKKSERKIEVKLNSLKKRSEFYQLTLKKICLPINSQIIPKLKVGDTIAVHWQQVIKILTQNEEENLTYWSKQVLQYQPSSVLPE